MCLDVLEISLHSTFLGIVIKAFYCLAGCPSITPLLPALKSPTRGIHIDFVMSEPDLSSLKSPPACSAWNPSIPNGFGYRPSLAAGIVFTILFSCTLALHLWQTARHRKFWLGAAFSIGALGEVIGWAARVAAYPCPYSTQLMEMQLAALIMGMLQCGLDSYLLLDLRKDIEVLTMPNTAPAFTAAGIYGILTLVIPVVGRDKSLLSPRLYLIIFMIVDFFSGALQAIGGGLTGAAFGQGSDVRPGTYTMVAGVVWQLVSTCVFATLFELVILRARHIIWGNPYLLRAFAATMLAVTCMVIRGVYRSMELIQGWRGYLFTHERFALVLDAAMMFIAAVVFNLWNPGFLIPRAARYEEEAKERVEVEGMTQPDV